MTFSNPSGVRHLPATERNTLESTWSTLERVALDAIPDAIVIVDTENRIVRINRALARNLEAQPEEFRGVPCSRLIHGEDSPPPACPYGRLLIDGQEHAAELTIPRMGGRCLVTASPINGPEGGLSGSILVIRSAGTADETVPGSASDGPSGLGLLAGGIAHDFNNLLTTIQGNAELARMDLPADSPVCENIDEIDDSTTRAAEICRLMLDYAGKGTLEMEALNLSAAIEAMREGLEAGVGSNIAFDYQLADDLPRINADQVQLVRLLQSLVTNAREAIDGNAGVVTVRTGVLECGASCRADVRYGHELTEGRCVYLEVSDTGCGMDRITLDSLCDPYFSTKFAGRGLSLSAALGIIRGHGGALRVWSEQGQGSIFLVLFPFIREEENRAADTGADPDEWRGCGTVLIVDDERPVRTVGRRMLERMGFDVLLATNGREGVDVFRENAHRITCVLLDLTMPEMDGEAAFREMRQVRDDVPVVLASGYSEEEVLGRFRGEGLSGFLHKPYRFKLLRSTIRSILEG